jgi:hypothetical protein
MRVSEMLAIGDTRLIAIGLLSSLVFTPSASAEPDSSKTVRTWRLKDAFATPNAVPANPALDEHGHPVWHFLRTTKFSNPTPRRRWNLNGDYARLADSGPKLFGADVTGWIFKGRDGYLAPLVARYEKPSTDGITWSPGDVVVAPGPEHAVVIGWRSPVRGRLEMKGLFEHAQTCCGVNSQVNWYVQRMPIDDGDPPETLARGHADFGSATPSGSFHLVDLSIKANESFYFVVDAHADGTNSPHHGDGTRFDVTITVRDAVEPPPPTFEKEIRPILARACFSCHGESDRESQLDLRTVTSILRGGESGHAIVRGDAKRSLLFDLVARREMPPDDEKLTASETRLIERWIEANAPAAESVRILPPRTQLTAADRQFWAFRTPAGSDPPVVVGDRRQRTAIDAFLSKRLADARLEFSPDANRETLMRRAYWDLTGLPPSPVDIDAFIEDAAPDAWERLLDRLLASPQYGVRWGRHWLDAVGYVDNRLFDGDLATIIPNEGIWRYRDYVIQAFNEDLPYDQFVTEQLAGDELVDWRNAETLTPQSQSQLAATGFFRSIEDHTSEPQYGIDKRYEVVFDTMQMMTTSLLGLTMQCCRCHNHKYDPLTQRDYFRLMATIEPALNPHQWIKPQERWQADVSPTEREQIDQHNADAQRQVDELNKQLETAKKAQTERKTGGSSDKSKESLAGEAEIARLTAKIAALNASKRSYGKMQVLWDATATPPRSRVLRRGDPHAPGILVTAGFPEVLTAGGAADAIRPKMTQGASTGLRLALANWLTDRRNPLVARVIVNRVWLHHFGRGIVATPGNFGRSGSPPTHPELLDHLAIDFIEHGWSIKRLHRQIMTSTAYLQQSAAVDDATGQTIDAENQLLWRMNLRRLEAEVLRDGLLAIGGNLSLRSGGPPVMITKPSDGLSRETPGSSGYGGNRRSVYLFARRVYPLKFLETFDAPIVPINCTKRSPSATVLQSFTQLNDEFMIRQADRLAARVGGMKAEEKEQIEVAWRTVLSRRPRPGELQSCRVFLREQREEYQQTDSATAAHRALTDLCHMLLCTNEFLYVE